MAVIHIGPMRDEQSGRRTLETVVKEYPDTESGERAQYYIATLERWQKRWQEALREYEKFMKMYPKSDYIPYINRVVIPELETHTGGR